MSSSTKSWSNGMPEIGIIGGGMSGLCAAVRLQQKLAITSFTIFEKNADVGGVWLTHTYPGCEVDIPGHFYSYSFEPNSNWSVNYPPQHEILEYLRSVTGKHRIYDHIKFQHEVKTMTWNDDLKKWILEYTEVDASSIGAESDLKTQMFDIVIMALGGLRIPCIPNELKGFTGPTMHTAEWNHEIELKNKKVAVIGSGASAIQVIPNIVNDVETLHCYQRKAAYVIPRTQFSFPNFVKQIFFYIPFIMWLYRCLIFMLHEIFHAAFYRGSLMHRLMCRITKSYRERELKAHKDLCDDLTPKYSFGCKRALISDEYYAAMTQPNVRLHMSHIDKIVGQTIYTKDGTKEEIDILILATGYNVYDYFSPLKVFGKHGQNALQTWFDNEPRCYYGTVFNAAPNAFVLLGPNSAPSHTSVIFTIECQVDFMINAVREMMHRHATVMNVKTSAVDEFMDKLRADMTNKVWYEEDCGSWWANSRGTIVSLWSDYAITFWRQTRTIDWSKFEIN